MRDWLQYFSEKKPLASNDRAGALRQVEKTVMGQPISSEQLALIVQSVLGGLSIDTRDNVLDLGCGNGLITSSVATMADAILGIDASPVLIETARAHFSPPNCSYRVADICSLAAVSDLPFRATKCYSYEVLQHLSGEQVEQLLRNLVSELGEFALFAASLPDAGRIRNFYNTKERWELYERNKAAGQEQIGHWWGRDELAVLSQRVGLRCETFDQPENLYTAHYRFNAVIATT
jgi:SAM-dependent methyltransferase